jgi:hypothetical protein
MKLSENTKLRLPYLIGSIAILYLLKPSILFKPNGRPRQYGIGYDDEGYKKTFYTFQLAVILIVVLTILFIK